MPRNAGWSFRALHGQRALWALGLVGVLLFSLPLSAQTYGYKQAEDPLIKGVKKAIQVAREKDFDQLTSAFESLQWQVDELKEDIAIDMSEPLGEALKSKDIRRVTYSLTELVFHAILQKFHWNENESLKKFVPARSRIEAAEFYYDEILSHAVRRADKSLKAQRHRTIKAEFKALKKSLGSTGLFGVGKRAPDLAAHQKSSKRIEKLLREVYTDFRKRPSTDVEGGG